MIYWYRVRKSSWGIAIMLECEIDSSENVPEAVLVCDSIYLETQNVAPYRITPEELSYLAAGIKMIALQLQPVLSQPAVIRVLQLVYSNADYQPEGLAYAIAGWLAQKYQLHYEFPPVTFDKAQNRYLFILE